MNPKLISAQAEPRSKDRSFKFRELGRIVGLAWPHRGVLALGLASTVVFAALHTFSIAGAFPVFKILLEREGLMGWVDRSTVEDRIGASFLPVEDGAELHVTEVDAGGPADAGGISPFSKLRGTENQSAGQLLYDLAIAAENQPESLVLVDETGRTMSAEVTLDPVTWKHRALRRAASWLPSGDDTARLSSLKYILVALVVVVLVANSFRYAGEVLIARAILRSMMDLRGRLYERTLRLPMGFFAGRPTAEVVTHFVQDIQEVQRGLMTLFGKFIREPLRAVLILALAFMFDWRITLTMLVVTPIAVAIFLAVGRSVKKANRKLLQSYGMMIGALTASLQNLRVVKAYTAEPYEQKRLKKVDWRMFKQQYKLARLQAFVSPMMETLAVCGGGLVTVWLASRVLNHELELSKFVSLGVILSMLFDPLRKLTDVYVRLQRSTAGAERVFAVLDEPVEQDVEQGHAEVAPLKDRIEFDRVTFTYPGAEVPALQEVTMTVSQGETLALVGPNGCGKTTLVSMLSRFFDPQSGEIRYDGMPLVEADLCSLRRQVGWVSQDAIVFEGTPTDNIAYGHEQPDLEAARDAARRASAHEFIERIPGGFDAALGERGSTLSGGQRQRLAIARAIFRDAPILVFDEATSQIDSESEAKIQQALQEFSKGRTTIIIAHRLSTIQFADRIVVMDQGRILDTGTHAELFDRCPLYKSLCETQFVAEPESSG